MIMSMMIGHFYVHGIEEMDVKGIDDTRHTFL